MPKWPLLEYGRDRHPMHLICKVSFDSRLQMLTFLAGRKINVWHLSILPLLLRHADREESSILPFISAGFTRVSLVFEVDICSPSIFSWPLNTDSLNSFCECPGIEIPVCSYFGDEPYFSANNTPPNFGDSNVRKWAQRAQSCWAFEGRVVQACWAFLPGVHVIKSLARLTNADYRLHRRSGSHSKATIAAASNHPPTQCSSSQSNQALHTATNHQRNPRWQAPARACNQSPVSHNALSVYKTPLPF